MFQLDDIIDGYCLGFLSSYKCRHRTIVKVSLRLIHTKTRKRMFVLC